MKRLLTSTALGVVLLSFNANAATMDPQKLYTAQPSDIRASEFIGSRVYASETDYSASGTFKKGEDKSWDDIGEINDVILDRDGDVEAVILGVGGFVGIGEKDVAVSMRDIEFVRDGNDAGDYKLVINANKKVLTDAPSYMTSGKADKMAMKTGSTDPDRLVRPDVTVDGYTPSDMEDLTAEMVTGAPVYGPKDENIGEVASVVLSEDGTVKHLVLDIGGFLGLGEHRIAVDPEEVNIVRKDGGDDLRVYVNSDEKALSAKPEYKAG